MTKKYHKYHFIMFGALLFLILELALKAYFLLPLPVPKIKDFLETQGRKRQVGRTLATITWDKDLNYRLKENFPHLEDYLKWSLLKDKFEVATNEEGFRYPPKHSLKGLEAISERKVICLGESWTMGWGVEYTDSYPAQLQEILDKKMPGQFYVVNLGVITYTSFQGVAILENILKSVNPGDIVVIGYNANDPRHPVFFTNSGKNIILNEKVFNDLTFHTASGLTSYKLLKVILYPLFSSVCLNHFNSFWDYIPRVPYPEYYSNVLKMISMAKDRGARSVLLFHGILKEEDYVAKALYAISRLMGVPVVNVNKIYSDMLEAHIRDTDREYQSLKSHSLSVDKLVEGQNITITFRVLPFRYIDELKLQPEDIARVEVALLDDPGDKVIRETLELNDEGRDGDEIKGDGVWSVNLSFKPNIKLLKLAPRYINGRYQGEYDLYFHFFFRLIDRNGREYNEYTVPIINPLFVNLWRSLIIGKIKDQRNDYLTYAHLPKCKILFYQEIVTPIYSFGRQYMKSEFLHPTIEGYGIFAQEIFKAICETEFMHE